MEQKNLREVYVLGIGQSKFAKQPTVSAEELGVVAAGLAIEDAGIDPRKFQVAYAGRIEDASTTSQAVLQHFGVQHIESINVENACSTGATAVHCLWKDIAYGIHDVGIAMGIESISTSSIAGGLVPSAKGSFNDHIGHTAIANSALPAQRMMKSRGCTLEDLAYAAWKNHRAAVFNPYAHYRKELSMEEIVLSEMIASPVTKLMCCPNSDGAAAVILCTKGIAMRYTTKLVKMSASFLTSGSYQDTGTELDLNTGLPRTCRDAYEYTGVGPMDLSCIEMHDAFSPEELLSYERMLLCPPYECKSLIQSGAVEMGGSCPVNLSGGLLSLGHPLGASGARVVCDVTRQLRGEAPAEVQINSPRAGMAQMEGGVLYGRSSEAVFISILTV